MKDTYKGAEIIALVDWNWTGHHPTYFQLYTRALLELGFDVFGLCPSPHDVLESLEQAGLGSDLIERLTLEKLEWHDLAKFPHPRRLTPALSGFLFFRHVEGRIRSWEKSRGISVDLTFFSCIYDHEFKFFNLAWKLSRRRWAGLYLHCRAFRMPGTVNPGNGQRPCPERFLRASNHHALAVLDEGVGDQVTALSGRPAVFFPDLTETQTSGKGTVLSRKLSNFAAGRRIVGSLGHQQYSKGVSHLASVAERPQLSDIVVAVFGDVAWASFPESERIKVANLNRSSPNAFTDLTRLTDELEFNSVFTTCDIIYAAYVNFPNSSNILTKCAEFEKPVIVTDGSLMAERVRTYRMGEIIPEGDINAAEAAILLLAKDPEAWISNTKPRWKEYRELHSYETLKHRLGELIDL